MTESIKLLFSLIFSFGWAFFFYLSFFLIKKFAKKEDVDRGPVTLIDVSFFILSCYAFYSTFFRETLLGLASSNTTSLFVKVLFVVCFLFSYLGLFGAVAYFAPIVRTYFRYGVGLLVAYALLVGTIGVFISGNGAYGPFYRQSWDIYQWFLVVLFPLEIGVFAHRVVAARLKRA